MNSAIDDRTSKINSVIHQEVKLGLNNLNKKNNLFVTGDDKYKNLILESFPILTNPERLDELIGDTVNACSRDLKDIEDRLADRTEIIIVGQEDAKIEGLAGSHDVLIEKIIHAMTAQLKTSNNNKRKEAGLSVVAFDEMQGGLKAVMVTKIGIKAAKLGNPITLATSVGATIALDIQKLKSAKNEAEMKATIQQFPRELAIALSSSVNTQLKQHAIQRLKLYQ